MAATLVLGGPGNGTTAHAESLLRSQGQVTHVRTRSAAGSAGGRPEPSSDRTDGRPGSWLTVETADLTRALLASRCPVLVDCLTEWVRAHLDAEDLWDEPDRARECIEALLAELAVAARAMPFPVVLLAQELSWAPPPQDPRQRLLVELNGHVTQTLAASCRHVHAVIAGRVLDLSDAPSAC